MTARELFKNIPYKGKVIKLSKGGYREPDFGYRIVDTGKEYQITVLSPVHPKEYTVPYGPETTAITLENAILYNEWRARVMHNKQLEAQS